LVACGSETTTQNEPKKATPEKTLSEKKPDMRVPTTAVDETDIVGRMAFGMRTLQEQYDRSSGDMPALGKVTVNLDERANLSIKNEINGEIKETKINLRDLDTAQGAFRLLPDSGDGDYPGLLIQTIRNAQKVEHLVNGKVRQRNSELQIFMTDREAIEAITPAILQTIRLAKTIK
jgi:hypothetical protein